MAWYDRFAQGAAKTAVPLLQDRIEDQRREKQAVKDLERQKQLMAYGQNLQQNTPQWKTAEYELAQKQDPGSPYSQGVDLGLKAQQQGLDAGAIDLAEKQRNQQVRAAMGSPEEVASRQLAREQRADQVTEQSLQSGKVQLEEATELHGLATKARKEDDLAKSQVSQWLALYDQRVAARGGDASQLTADDHMALMRAARANGKAFLQRPEYLDYAKNEAGPALEPYRKGLEKKAEMDAILGAMGPEAGADTPEGPAERAPAQQEGRWRVGTDTTTASQDTTTQQGRMDAAVKMLMDAGMSEQEAVQSIRDRATRAQTQAPASMSGGAPPAAEGRSAGRSLVPENTTAAPTALAEKAPESLANNPRYVPVDLASQISGPAPGDLVAQSRPANLPFAEPATRDSTNGTRANYEKARQQLVDLNKEQLKVRGALGGFTPSEAIERLRTGKIPKDSKLGQAVQRWLELEAEQKAAFQAMKASRDSLLK